MYKYILTILILISTGCASLSKVEPPTDYSVRDNIVETSIDPDIRPMALPGRPDAMLFTDKNGVDLMSFNAENTALLLQRTTIAELNTRVGFAQRDIISNLLKNEKSLIGIALKKEEFSNDLAVKWSEAENELTREKSINFLEVWGYRISISALLLMLLL